MPLINCGSNLILAWSANCFICEADRATSWVETKDHNFMIDRRNFFDQPIRNSIEKYKNIRKITTGQRYDCTTVYILDSSYFKENYKLIAIDLSKQVLDADRKFILL